MGPLAVGEDSPLVVVEEHEEVAAVGSRREEVEEDSRLEVGGVSRLEGEEVIDFPVYISAAIAFSFF